MTSDHNPLGSDTISDAAYRTSKGCTLVLLYGALAFILFCAGLGCARLIGL